MRTDHYYYLNNTSGRLVRIVEIEPDFIKFEYGNSAFITECADDTLQDLLTRLGDFDDDFDELETEDPGQIYEVESWLEEQIAQRNMERTRH